ncbi:MAG: hypothetical protein ACK4LR_01035 [Acidovorax temperans]|uniref:hypothetical protein n=1 Tax=Acidovorax temperans TaxID=80878 RepID=UPI003919F96D
MALDLAFFATKTIASYALFISAESYFRCKNSFIETRPASQRQNITHASVHEQGFAGDVIVVATVNARKPMPPTFSIETIFSIAGALAIVQFLLSLWIAERLKSQLQLENAKVLEAMKWEVRVREQAAKVAEYMSATANLAETDPPERYAQLNRLSWELALWLPSDVYRSMGQALTHRTETENELTVIMQVRKHLLGDQAGDLSSEEIVVHSPGIGKHRYLARK